jgi:hypothetical protein
MQNAARLRGGVRIFTDLPRVRGTIWMHAIVPRVRVLPGRRRSAATTAIANLLAHAFGFINRILFAGSPHWRQEPGT